MEEDLKLSSDYSRVFVTLDVVNCLFQSTCFHDSTSIIHSPLYLAWSYKLSYMPIETPASDDYDCIGGEGWFYVICIFIC